MHVINSICKVQDFLRLDQNPKQTGSYHKKKKKKNIENHVTNSKPIIISIKTINFITWINKTCLRFYFKTIHTFNFYIKQV